MKKFKKVKVGNDFDIFECKDCGASHPRHITNVTVSDGDDARPKWPHWSIVVALIAGVMWSSVLLCTLAMGYLTHDYSQMNSLIELFKQFLAALISLVQGSKK
jgi:hypothetical protein